MSAKINIILRTRDGHEIPHQVFKGQHKVSFALRPEQTGWMKLEDIGPPVPICDRTYSYTGKSKTFEKLGTKVIPIPIFEED